MVAICKGIDSALCTCAKNAAGASTKSLSLSGSHLIQFQITLLLFCSWLFWNGT